MKILKAAENKDYRDLNDQKYEFRACGGSIEPDKADDKNKRQDEQKRS